MASAVVDLAVIGGGVAHRTVRYRTLAGRAARITPARPSSASPVTPEVRAESPAADEVPQPRVAFDLIEWEPCSQSRSGG